MKKINDGGPVFPVRVENNGDEPFSANGVEVEPGYFVQFRGMTLRDYFAAKAMQGLLSSPTDPSSAKAAAEWSYEMADAMLAAREQSELQAE